MVKKSFCDSCDLDPNSIISDINGMLFRMFSRVNVEQAISKEPLYIKDLRVTNQITHLEMSMDLTTEVCDLNPIRLDSPPRLLAMIDIKNNPRLVEAETTAP